MNRRSIPFAIGLLLAVAGLSAQGLKVAVMDFALESDNPQFKYLGKGFTELTSVEVARLRGFTLVDRERRNDILEEQAFALSGAVDESGAMKIGELLSVDYFVVGSIIDMMGGLVVTYSVVRTDSGAVVGKMKTEGAPTEYKRMVKEIGAGIAAMTGKEAAVAVAKAAPPPPVAKQAEVLTSFSEAVAALDAKDVKTAAKKLEEARKIDPSDPAVRFYLDKLAAGTSKFAVIPEVYFSMNNPASLAWRDADLSYFHGAFGGTYLTGKDWPGFSASVFPAMVELDGLYGQNAGGSPQTPAKYGDRELDSRTFFGYGTPIGEHFGLGAQAFFSHVESNVQREANTGGSPGDDMYVAGWNSLNFYGGELLLSWAPSKRLSLGIGGTVGSYDGYVRDWQLAGQGVTSPTLFYGGVTTTMNGFLDLSLTWGFNAMRDFAVPKFTQNIYGFSGAMPPFLQLLPAFERWFGSALSVRAGGVLSMSPRETLYVGYGANLGATYRNRPSKIYSAEIIPETVFSVGIRKNGLIVKRR